MCGGMNEWCGTDHASGGGACAAAPAGAARVRPCAVGAAPPLQLSTTMPPQMVYQNIIIPVLRLENNNTIIENP